MGNPFKLGPVANESIIALFLPKRLSGEAQHFVALSGGESLERLHQLGNLYAWSDQEVNVVSHDDITVKIIVPQFVVAILNSFDHHPGDLRLSKVQRTGARVVEDAVHRHEGSSGA